MSLRPIILALALLFAHRSSPFAWVAHRPSLIAGASSPIAGVSSIVVSGTVFDDRNGNGRRDPGEPGIRGVAVSNQDTVVVTDADGAYRMLGVGVGVIHVSVPMAWSAKFSFWRVAPSHGADVTDFPLVRSPAGDDFLFVHASDTHISPASAPRTVRLRQLVDSIQPAFTIITGDLVRDALRVGENEATGYYELFNAEAAKFTGPVWTVPGNHENFGIERKLSGVAADHPLYGRAMYHHFRGPDYYSFNAGGIHFVALNSVDIDDQSYYGHVDSLQLAWLARDLAAVPASVPVITFNHIPFYTAVETINGLMEGGPAPSVITVHGVSSFRHSVSNARDVLARIKGHLYPMALGGHMHVREQLRYEGVATRFNQAAAIVGDTPGPAGTFPSGITVYRVHRGTVDDGRFVQLQPAAR
jgi:hypothetical protein